MLVFCPNCEGGYGSYGRLPDLCPSCLARVPRDRWLHSDPKPRRRWLVTRRDWFFLLVIGVDPERNHCNPDRA